MSNREGKPTLAVVRTTGAVGTVMLDLLSTLQRCLGADSAGCVRARRKELTVPR